MLLHTDNASEIPQPASSGACHRSPQYSNIPHEDSRCRFTLTLHENSDIDTAANNIAQCVVKAGARLYQLRPVVQGLEAVFHEVNSDGA